MTWAPAVGAIVTAFTEPLNNDGAELSPAIITRVHSETSPGVWMVDAVTFLAGDHGPETTPKARLYVGDEAAARRAWSGDVDEVPADPPFTIKTRGKYLYTNA